MWETLFSGTKDGTTFWLTMTILSLNAARSSAPCARWRMVRLSLTPPVACLKRSNLPLRSSWNHADAYAAMLREICPFFFGCFHIRACRKRSRRGRSYFICPILLAFQHWRCRIRADANARLVSHDSNRGGAGERKRQEYQCYTYPIAHQNAPTALDRQYRAPTLVSRHSGEKE